MTINKGERYILEIQRDWLEKLILEEQAMTEGELLSSDFYGSKASEKEILEEKTFEFLSLIKDAFEKYVVYFNEFKEETEEGRKSRLKLYKLSTKKPGFMIYRHGFQMIFYTLVPGEICIHLTESEKSSQDKNRSKEDEHKLQAQFIAYGQLEWFFNSLRVDLNSMVRYYLTHFIRVSQIDL